MANVQQTKQIKNYSASHIYSKIVKEQGFNTLWRGNNANLYRHFILISMNVSIFDRVKQKYMPQDPSRYQGLDFLWRYCASTGMLMGITAGLVYPLDLIHTRLTSDMTIRGDKRLYATTFDCFNRTNIDEGFRAGVYKGVEISMVSSALRAGMALPLYSVLRSDKV